MIKNNICVDPKLGFHRSCRVEITHQLKLTHIDQLHKWHLYNVEVQLCVLSFYETFTKVLWSCLRLSDEWYFITFISYSIKLFIYLYPLLWFWHACAISCHWSAFLYERPNEAKKGKEKICPSETTLNQCDIFTPELWWASRPHFSARQPRHVKGRQGFWTVSAPYTQTVNANNRLEVKICIQTPLWLTPLEPALGCAERERGQVISSGSLQSIHQSGSWFNHLTLKTVNTAGEQL